jgi:hypothetical protein
VRHPTWGQEAWWLFEANWGVALPLGAALLWLLLWWRYGRDSLAGATIVPEFEAPLGLKPSEVGVLADERMDARDVSACLIDLAVRGRIEIDMKGKEPVFRRRGGRGDDALSGYENEILEGLFRPGEDTGKARSNRLGKRMARIRDGIYKGLVARRLFRGHPERVREGWKLATGVVFALAAVGGFFWATPWVNLVVLVPCAVVMFLCAKRMPQRTGQGLEALRRIRGLEDYLETAERRQLETMPRDHFEKLLPFAIALGVHDRWTEMFSELFREAPAWLVMNGRAFPDTMDRFVRSTRRSTHYMPPRTHSSGGSGGGWSGGSGFGGGGFSGGGLGGGGGGGW